MVQFKWLVDSYLHGTPIMVSFAIPMVENTTKHDSCRELVKKHPYIWPLNPPVITESCMAMDQYLLIPFLGEWTSICQLFWGSPGTRVLTHPRIFRCLQPMNFMATSQMATGLLSAEVTTWRTARRDLHGQIGHLSSQKRGHKTMNNGYYYDLLWLLQGGAP